MSEETNARVKTIIVEHLGVDPAAVLPETLLVPLHDARGVEIRSGQPNLGADSLDVVELVMALEEEFGIEITDDEAEPLNTGTVQDCYDLIARKVASKSE